MHHVELVSLLREEGSLLDPSDNHEQLSDEDDSGESFRHILDHLHRREYREIGSSASIRPGKYIFQIMKASLGYLNMLRKVT